ncbi:olfactory receptor 8H1 [Ehrlichia ruminantium]|uniref:Olfactory receptor 8H1 n=1 Tax=Ehrlichia ruminantium TaxID=779 RepID=A0A170RSV3_EHRRU|nr:olfactory receptor 8H1 [Ehrlichia ruminantium]GAT77155.1 olfactory receptor 8H1 [Ehrlichia ruminantium]
MHKSIVYAPAYKNNLITKGFFARLELILAIFCSDTSKVYYIIYISILEKNMYIKFKWCYVSISIDLFIYNSILLKLIFGLINCILLFTK